jgi:AraC-like DNA-binding protein
MRRPDHHNEVELNFLETGSVTYLLGGTKTTVQAGKLSAFWAAIPHQIISFGSNTAYYVATIPLQCFLQWRLSQNIVEPLMQGRMISEPSSERADNDTELFEQWEHDLQGAAPKLEQPVLLEMQARLIRLALNVPERPRPRTQRDRIATITTTGLNKVEQMACFIAQNYTEKLTVQQIGEFVKLHPNYAMNLFQKGFGTTLIDYLTQHRISHAQRLLATTEMTVTEIAFQSGFMSISRFNEAFRRACGCPPRQYRKLHELDVQRL